MYLQISVDNWYDQRNYILENIRQEIYAEWTQG